jgi:hypothetical protein
MSGAVFGGLVLQNYGLLKSALNYTVLIYTLLESGEVAQSSVRSG